MFLKHYSTEALWKEIFRREGFSTSGYTEGAAVWKEVYNRTPVLKDWMKKRESILLSSIALDEVKNQFVLGQLAENRLYTKFDIPNRAELKVVEEDKAPPIDKKSFLSKWNKKDADSSKEV